MAVLLLACASGPTAGDGPSVVDLETPTSASASAAPPKLDLGPLEVTELVHPGKAGAFSDSFGDALAISADGTTLVVGAWTTPSAGFAKPSDTDFTGMAFVYVREGLGFRKTATLKPPHPLAGMGMRVAVSADGRRIAVSAMGVDGSREEEVGPAERGLVLVYDLGPSGWTESARIVSEEPLGFFGHSMAMSSDGATIAVGAFKERDSTGAVHVYARRGVTWSRTSTLRGEDAGDGFGHQLALAADGKLLAISEPFADESAGAVKVFAASATGWKLTSHLSPPQGTADFLFGTALAMSADGKHLAVNGMRPGAGASAVHTYAIENQVARPDGYLESPVDDGSDEFGAALALSADGAVLVVGADHGARLGGRVHTYVRKTTWLDDLELLQPRTDPSQENFVFFGQGLTVSADGVFAFISAQQLTTGGGSVFPFQLR